MTEKLPSPEELLVILVVEAHPDDATVYAGGTIAKLAADGHTIINLATTFGEKGTLDQSMTREQMIEIEKDEAQRAAKVLGVKDVIYLEIPDGELTNSPDLRQQYIKVIRQVKPDLVFSFDPYCPYEPHPDHRLAGRTIYEACFLSHFHLYYPEQLKNGTDPHFVNKFYGWNSPNPNLYVDISKTLDTKIQALHQYASQMQMLLEEMHHRLKLAKTKLPALEKMTWQDAIRFWVTRNSQRIGEGANLQYAEAFNVIPMGTLGVVTELLKLDKNSPSRKSQAN